MKDRIFDTVATIEEVSARADAFAAKLAGDLHDPLNEFQGMPSDGESETGYRAMGEAGWIGLHWPPELGGGGLSELHTAAVEERFGYHWLPLCGYTLSVKTIGNAMLRYAAPELTERLLPGVAAGEISFCQGFSEPGAGSDLARLRTRARRERGGYVVSGQKIWTSGAQLSNWIYLAVRTDPEAVAPHRGLTVLVCPMSAPGIEVRSFETLGGGALCEVFLDEVHVPDGHVVGRRDGGWEVLMGTLDYERVTSEKVGVVARLLDELDELVCDPGQRRTLTAMRGELDAARELGLEAVRQLMRGAPASGVSSMCKLSVARLCQRLGGFGIEVLGAEALVDAGVERGLAARLAALRRAAVGSTIAGGAAEIQRRVIARRGLGLASH